MSENTQTRQAGGSLESGTMQFSFHNDRCCRGMFFWPRRILTQVQHGIRSFEIRRV